MNWKVEMPQGLRVRPRRATALPARRVGAPARQPIRSSPTSPGQTVEGGRRPHAWTIMPDPDASATASSGASAGSWRPMDGTWRDDKGVDDWADLQGRRRRPRRTLARRRPRWRPSLWLDKKTREDEDFSRRVVVSARRSTPRRPRPRRRGWTRNVNVPEIINYMAIDRADPRHRRRVARTGGWLVTPRAPAAGRCGRGTSTGASPTRTRTRGRRSSPRTSSNKLYVAMLAHPQFREMYFRRLRTLADSYLVPGAFEAKWDAVAQTYPADWALDAAKWGGRTLAFARQKFLVGPQRSSGPHRQQHRGGEADPSVAVGQPRCGDQRDPVPARAVGTPASSSS